MARELKFDGRPVWAEVSLSALRHNLRAIRKHIGGKRKILAIVKANAYGHGAIEVSRALEKAGADWFGITCTSEGAELREAGIRKPILVLTGCWPGEEEALLRKYCRRSTGAAMIMPDDETPGDEAIMAKKDRKSVV